MTFNLKMLSACIAALAATGGVGVAGYVAGTDSQSQVGAGPSAVQARDLVALEAAAEAAVDAALAEKAAAERAAAEKAAAEKAAAEKKAAKKAAKRAAAEKAAAEKAAAEEAATSKRAAAKEKFRRATGLEHVSEEECRIVLKEDASGPYYDYCVAVG